MGNLVTETPYSEITATLEVLQSYGVDRRHLELIRKDPARASVVAQTMIGGYVVLEPRQTPGFKVFKTIKLGTGLVTADDFRSALKQPGYIISDEANDILGHRAFAAATKETEADLVVVSVAELGFPNGATSQDIYRKAKKLGLMLCPAEVGPQLRLRYKDQPPGEWLLIGMKSIITDLDRGLYVLCVGRNVSGSWLNSRYGRPDHVWDGDYRWVFLRRHRTSA